MIEARLIQLFASRICHDLISPLGAINNGLEFMREMGADANDDAVDLIAHSAHQATIKLETFRALYGAGSAQRDFTQTDCYDSAQKLLSLDNKITLDWDHTISLMPSSPQGIMKLLLGTIILAQDCMPRGGCIRVYSEGDNIYAHATNAPLDSYMLQPDLNNILQGHFDLDQADPKTIPAIILHYFCKYYDLSISIDQPQNNGIIFTIG